MNMPEKITVSPVSKEWDLGYLHCYRQFQALNKGTVCMDGMKLTKEKLAPIIFNRLKRLQKVTSTIDADYIAKELITYLTKGK